MSVDTNDDNIVNKIKKQALKAIEQEKDETRKWKLIAEALKYNDNDDNSNSKKGLVQYVIEQVYRETKKQLSSSSSSSSDEKLYSQADIINKFKKIMISSSDDLCKTMPNIVLLNDTTTNNTTTNTTKDTNDSNDNNKKDTSNNTNTIKSNTSSSSSSLPLSSSSSSSISNHLSVKNTTIPSDSTITIDISHTIEQPRPGVVSKKYTTYYNIRSNTYNTTTNECISNEVQRRYSEFVTLYQRLCNEYPNIIIPSLLPDTNNKQNLPAQRLRQLTLWLKYLVLHGQIQKSPLLLRFIESDEKLKTRTASMSNSNSSTATIGTHDIIDSMSYGSTKISHHHHHHHHHDNKIDNIIINIPNNIDPKISLLVSKQFSLREMNTMRRDVQQLQVSSNFATDSCKKLSECYHDVGTTLKLMQGTITIIIIIIIITITIIIIIIIILLIKIMKDQ